MSNWKDEPQPRAPLPSLGADLMGIGPASTPTREVLAAFVQIGAVVLLLFVVFPDRLSELWSWAIVGAMVVYFVLRALGGLAKWRRRR